MPHRIRTLAASSPAPFRLLLFALLLLAAACGDGETPPTEPYVPPPPEPDPQSSAHILTSYGFLSASNPGLTGSADADFDGSDVLINVPRTANVTSLAGTFTVSDLAHLEIGDEVQVSGSTRNDFTARVQATVVAEDGSKGDYAIYVGRQLEAGEIMGWQRSTEWFRYVADPAEIRAIDQTAARVDSTFPLVADTLGVTYTDSIEVFLYPSKAAMHEAMRHMGRGDPEEWVTGASMGDTILMLSPDAPDAPGTITDLISTLEHEAAHSLISSYESPVPIWMHEGLAQTATAPGGLLDDCFPHCQGIDYSWQKFVIGDTGKPDLETMFPVSPEQGYAFSLTIPPFVVDRYGWNALRQFLRTPWDYSIFGLKDSHAFERAWYAYLDETWGALPQGHPDPISIGGARQVFDRRVTIEGTVTWQAPWNAGIYFVQDATAGLRVFQEYDAIPLEPGDNVRVTGLTIGYQGGLELAQVPFLTVLAHGAPPDPRPVTGAEINDGAFEGQLAIVEGAIETVTVLAYGNQQVTLRDDAGARFTVFADARVGMTAGAWPTPGSRVRVTGLLQPTDTTGPRLEIRRPEDVSGL